MTAPSDDAEAGAREPFADANLYDHEYRHRRADVNFYRGLVANRLEFAKGPVLDLGCGSGRLLFPLARDGHQVLGLDLSRAMLGQAAARVRRLSATRRSNVSLVQADLRRFSLAPRFTMAICAFHSIQHLYTDADLLAFLRNTRAALLPGGWLAFDVLPPDQDWIHRDPHRRYARTKVRHPKTGQRFIYTTNHTYDPVKRLLHMRLFYQPVDDRGEPAGDEILVRLCHRQLWPRDCERLLKKAGFNVLGTFAGFDGRSLLDFPEGADDHIYLASTPR
jgi:SAM-dependent methyltransferase